MVGATPATTSLVQSQGMAAWCWPPAGVVSTRVLHATDGCLEIYEICVLMHISRQKKRSGALRAGTMLDAGTLLPRAQPGGREERAHLLIDNMVIDALPFTPVHHN